MFNLKLKKENYETMIENRNILIADLERKNELLNKENIAVYTENKDLRFEIEETKDFMKEISKLITSSTYNNDKARLDKLKELVADSQSQN